jgi:3-hydroxyacyl-CoA dehydrogenase/enoyl-CoA hydratase/3-hydroxybutyryl-CoA epimerase
MRYEHQTYRHWQIEQESDGILWLRFSRADKDINTLSREVLEELNQILDGMPLKERAGLVICSGKPNGFIAGADVTEFSSVVDTAETLRTVEWVHAIFDRIERLPFPTVCLIRGFCMGGGLELALACRCRIAVDAPETRFGLPEIKLGIHPGFGGTVRLTRLAGPLRALDMMLSGRSIDARRALKIRLVDQVVPEHEVSRAVQSAVLQARAGRKSHFLNALFRSRFLRLALARYLRRRIAKRVPRKFYPAPYALLDLWERFGGDPAAMFREEARSVARLVTGVVSRNLVRIFLLQDRLRNPGRREEMPVRSVHVIGSGAMGGDIATWCALQGLRVTIQDIERERLEAAVRRASNLVREKIADPRRVQDVLNRFVPDLHGDGIAGADVVIEAIIEDAMAKRKLYSQVEPRMREDAILATNTSSIPLDELATSLTNPGRFLGLHFFNPVARMQLVEVVRGSTVDGEMFNRAIGFVAAIKRLPLPVAGSPGFLINRILMPYLLEAIIMEQEGIPAGEIDRAACEFGMPMGPLRLADTIGLDICLSAARVLAMHFKIAIPKRLEDLVATGALGKKSGRGFYIYKKGKPVISRKEDSRDPREDLTDRLMLQLLNESVACRREGIVSDDDLLDVGAVFGFGFPAFRGGPLQYIRTEGIETLLARFKALEERYGSRFKPDPGWSDWTTRNTAQCFARPVVNGLARAL